MNSSPELNKMAAGWICWSLDRKASSNATTLQKTAVVASRDGMVNAYIHAQNTCSSTFNSSLDHTPDPANINCTLTEFDLCSVKPEDGRWGCLPLHALIHWCHDISDSNELAGNGELQLLLLPVVVLSLLIIVSLWSWIQPLLCFPSKGSTCPDSVHWNEVGFHQSSSLTFVHCHSSVISCLMPSLFSSVGGCRGQLFLGVTHQKNSPF